ncbi:MAG: nucleotidyltransferase domain-containing protein [Candidatus Omnitrophica bacterium]|nr:nucleotidyltransferase domain-containing protein [Candidatus Omnitrophota bacterium]
MEKMQKVYPEQERIVLDLKSFFKKNAFFYCIDMAFLFGSWVRGYPRGDSDADVAIVFSKEILKEDRFFSLITEISYRLEEELRREVNAIAILEDFPHPLLYYNAIIEGIVLFVKDKDKLLYLKLRGISAMEDFRIFAVQWQKNIAENLIM